MTLVAHATHRGKYGEAIDAMEWMELEIAFYFEYTLPASTFEVEPQLGQLE